MEEERNDEYDFQNLLDLNLGQIDSEMLENTRQFVTLMSYYKCAMMEIETKFNVLNEEFSLQIDRQPISSIRTRLKNPISINRKLRSRNLPLGVESIEKNLSDVAGIRVICSFMDDVYMIADTIKKMDDITLIEEKDYIAYPKENGYRSLHQIVEVPIFLHKTKHIMKAEIQYRTISMDAWASMEYQIRYKKDHDFTDDMAYSLRQCADMSYELDRKMNALKSSVLGES